VRDGDRVQPVIVGGTAARSRSAGQA